MKFRDTVKEIGRGTTYITIPKKLGLKKGDLLEINIKKIKKEVK